MTIIMKDGIEGYENITHVIVNIVSDKASLVFDIKEKPIVVIFSSILQIVEEGYDFIEVASDKK